MDDVFLADDGFMIVSESSPTPTGRHSAGRSTTACAMEVVSWPQNRGRRASGAVRAARNAGHSLFAAYRMECTRQRRNARVHAERGRQARVVLPRGIAALVVEMLSQVIRTNG